MILCFLILYINEMRDFLPFQSGGYVFKAEQMEDFGLRFGWRSQDLILGARLFYRIHR